MKLFSYKDRPVHLGPYPLERLARQAKMPDLSRLEAPTALRFVDPLRPQSLMHAMSRYMTMFDVVRDGAVTEQRSDIPDDLDERARHLKAAGYYFDASMMGICALTPELMLATPLRNAQMQEMAQELESSHIESHAAGIDAIVADVLESATTPLGPLQGHTHALAILVEYPRDPEPDEPGADWIVGTQAQRAALLSAQTAVLLSSYLRLLGISARSHSATCAEVDMARVAVAAGLASLVQDGDAVHATNPYVGRRFGLAVVTCALEMRCDDPLSADPTLGEKFHSHGPAWWVGKGTVKGALRKDPYARRAFHMGPQPYETLQRREQPTTFIDHERVPRFPKRADFFARALFGDLGKSVQDAARNGNHVVKSPIGACARRALGALLLLQYGEARGPVAEGTDDAQRSALNLKAASYYMSTDAVGICGIPDWAYYSHDAAGQAIAPYHANALCMLLDQGHETMDGASGDDWIAVGQSMRAYLRFSLLGGVMAEQIRRLGYSARVHTVLDGDLLQPPLLLLSGLGEVSRIGEVILNPFLGPRLKSGVVSTSMPMQADQPIDFGMQRFCDSCNKCARECPSGAISAGPKTMYNGYEIWKTDAEKCTRYRITNLNGAMCGRCMKTCPWNLEGVLAETAARWVAMKFPGTAPWLAALDDALDRGSINPVKKWWWDLELDKTQGRFVQTHHVNARGLNKHIKLKAEDQTLAVYPADVMPAPYPVVQPLDREAGIARYRALLSPAQYKAKLAQGETDDLVPQFRMPEGPAPVFPVRLQRRQDMGTDVAMFEFVPLEGQTLPRFEAGAHIDVVIAPEYRRSYSLAGDPADASRYVLGVQREASGRGGSLLMHRAFREGRRVYITPPANHFPLVNDSGGVLLMAGGIGITPMIAMAHQLHREGRVFVLHYSAASRTRAAFVQELMDMPWGDKVQFHFKDEGQRASLASLIPAFAQGMHLYTCGSPRYMDGVFEQAQSCGWPEDALHREYFAVPEGIDLPMHPFVIRLAKSGRCIDVPEGQKATEALQAAGVALNVKCSDGICGVCASAYTAGQVDHRDHVLSKAERAHKVILCCSRTQAPNAELTLDL